LRRTDFGNSFPSFWVEGKTPTPFGGVPSGLRKGLSDVYRPSILLSDDSLYNDPFFPPRRSRPHFHERIVSAPNCYSAQHPPLSFLSSQCFFSPCLNFYPRSVFFPLFPTAPHFPPPSVGHFLGTDRLHVDPRVLLRLSAPPGFFIFRLVSFSGGIGLSDRSMRHPASRGSYELFREGLLFEATSLRNIFSPSPPPEGPPPSLGWHTRFVTCSLEGSWCLGKDWRRLVRFADVRSSPIFRESGGPLTPKRKGSHSSRIP